MSQNRENLHKAIYVNFHKKKLLLPNQGLYILKLYILNYPKTWSFVLSEH